MTKFHFIHPAITILSSTLLLSCGDKESLDIKKYNASSTQYSALNEFKWTSPSTATANSYGLAYQASFVAKDSSDWKFGLTGTDSEYFQISPYSGELSFISKIDKKYPWDKNKDGTYEIIVTAYNDSGAVKSLPLVITTENDNPEFLQEARILFPAQNSNLGLGIGAEITAIVKVGFSDNSPNRDPELLINDEPLSYVEGSDGLWQAKVWVDPGINRLDLNTKKVGSRLSAIYLHNTPPRDPSVKDPSAKCRFASGDMIVNATQVTDLKNGKIYFNSSDGLCAYNFDTKRASILTDVMGGSAPYTVIASSKDRQQLRIIDNHYEVTEYDPVSRQKAIFATQFNGPSGHFAGGFNLPISIDYSWEQNRAILANYNGQVLAVDLKSKSTELIRSPTEESQAEAGMFILNVNMDWSSNTAYLGTTDGNLIARNLEFADEKTLYSSHIDDDFISSAYRAKQHDLIIGGKSNGGLSRYDFSTGNVQSLVDNQGAGLDIKFSYNIELNRTDTVATFLDPIQHYFFLVSLITGDRVIIEGIVAPL